MTMSERLFIAIVFALLTCSTATAQARADSYLAKGSLMLTVEVGGAAFTDFQRGQAAPVAPTSELSDFERRVSARTSATVGAWMSYWVTSGVGVRVGGAWVPSAFRVWNEESAQQVIDARSGLETRSYAGLGVYMGEAAAVFRFPTDLGRVTPYAIIGAGIVHYAARDDAELPPEARRQFATGKWSGAAALVGLGAAIPLQRRDILLSFELTDHIARTPLDDRGAGEQFELGDMSFQLDPDPHTGSDGVGLTNNLRLVLGMTLPLRR
jgi:hypothetical protein